MPLTYVAKSPIWGGKELERRFGKHADASAIGETWELTVRESEMSVIRGGECDGMTIGDYIRKSGGKAVGRDFPSDGRFPLLIKFIDAADRLSVQVHPDDAYAARVENGVGKTEMWYVIDAAPGAELVMGLAEGKTPDDLRSAALSGADISSCLRYVPVKPGDCFFIPSGMIHAIGKGILIAEIQQTSDVTYRIYDYKRKDKNGNYRELHTKEAAEAIDYTVLDDYRTEYTPVKNEATQLVSCPLFTTAVYDLTEPMTLDYSELDSFVILIALKGEGSILTSSGNSYSFREGESILLPATTEMVKVEGNIKFLETFV